MKLEDLQVIALIGPVLTRAEVASTDRDDWVTTDVARNAVQRAVRDALKAAGVEIDPE